MTSPLKRAVKLAVIQLAAGSDKSINLQRASEKVTEAAEDGAELIVLPVKPHLRALFISSRRMMTRKTKRNVSTLPTASSISETTPNRYQTARPATQPPRRRHTTRYPLSPRGTKSTSSAGQSPSSTPRPRICTTRA